MKHFVAALLLAAAALSAQDAPKPPAARPTWHQRVFELKHVNPELLAPVLSVSPAMSVRPQRELMLLYVGSSDPEFLKFAEETIAKYDRPRATLPRDSALNRNIEVVVQVLLAGSDLKSGDAVPPDLQPVARNLTGLLGYKDIQLMDTGLHRVRAGTSAESTSQLPGLVDPSAPSTTTTLRFSANSRADEKGSVIQLDQFRFGARIAVPVGPPGAAATQWQFQELGINTTIDLREGQKVVVGKSRIGSTNRALILVLSAKVVD